VIARLNLGGPAQQVSLLSGRRFDSRFETLLVHGRLAAGEESMADLSEREGARTQFVGSLAQPVSPAADARALARLISIMRSYRPDIVHTHTAKAGFVGRAAALALRERPIIVHTYHGHVLEGYFGPAKSGLYRSLERTMARVSDLLIGVSQATVNDLVRLGVAPRERFRVVPLGTDLSRFAELDRDGERGFLREELGLTETETLLLFVGRLVPIKRVDVLIRAVARAVRDGAAVHLAVVGDGEMRRDLEALGSRLEIGGRVHFLGYRRDLPRIAAASDVAVLSSDNEGTPVALIEAAAAGLPVIATSVGGVAEVVSEDVGIVVPPRDSVAFGRAVVRLAADPALRRAMAERARPRALGSYSAERLLGDVRDVYDELLERGPPSAGPPAA
jgi:glycosyltransferase involved in cell wall biosynthesis